MRVRWCSVFVEAIGPWTIRKASRSSACVRSATTFDSGLRHFSSTTISGEAHRGRFPLAFTGDSALTVAWAVRRFELQRDVPNLEAFLQRVCRRHQQRVSVLVLSLQHEMIR